MADKYDRSPGLKRDKLKYGPNPKNTVVATVTDPTKYTRTDSSNQQEIRRSEAADAALNKQRGFVAPGVNTIEAQTVADKALAERNAFTDAFGNMGGSGGPARPKYSDRTDRMKVEESTRQFDITNALDQAQFDLQKSTTAQGRADAKAKFDALKNYYDTGGYKTGFDELNNIAVGQYNTGVEGLQGTYDRSQANLGAGYDLAQGITDQGYNTLQNYLQQNPNNAFVGLQQQVQPVANPMQQFLSAYGVDNQPVQAQVAAEQFAGEQGAGAFNSLADILRSAATQSDTSRMAEMQMAQTMANAGLGANRANYQARNAEAQAQALAQLQQALSGQQFGIQQNQMQAGQDIYNQILAATGNYGAGVPATGGSTNPNLTPEALQALEARRGMSVSPVSAAVQPPVVQNSGLSPEALQALMARRGM
jgi:hypothetical protein